MKPTWKILVLTLLLMVVGVAVISWLRLEQNAQPESEEAREGVIVRDSIGRDLPQGAGAPNRPVARGHADSRELAGGDAARTAEAATESGSAAQPSREPVGAAAANEIGLESRVRFLEAEEVPLASGEEAHSHKLAEWRGRLSPLPHRDWLGSDGQGGLRLALPDGSAVEVEVASRSVYGIGQGAFVGRLAGQPYSSFVMSYVGDAVAGSIKNTETGTTWEVRNAGDGRQYFAKVNMEALGRCALCAEGESR